MNCKKFMFVFFVLISSVILASDSDQLKKSTFIVAGTYIGLSLLDTVFPMKSSACSDAFTYAGGLVTFAALVINNDHFAGITTVGLIGHNIYARFQGAKSSLTSDQARNFAGTAWAISEEKKLKDFTR